MAPAAAPAFQLGRFRRKLHAVFNAAFARRLRDVIPMNGDARLLHLHNRLGLLLSDCPTSAYRATHSFLSRFQGDIYAVFNEDLGWLLLDALDLFSAEELPSALYTFRQKLAQRLNCIDMP
jgi:hypothetical protein